MCEILYAQCAHNGDYLDTSVWAQIFADHGVDPAGLYHGDADLHWEQYGCFRAWDNGTTHMDDASAASDIWDVFDGWDNVKMDAVDKREIFGKSSVQREALTGAAQVTFRIEPSATTRDRNTTSNQCSSSHYRTEASAAAIDGNGDETAHHENSSATTKTRASAVSAKEAMHLESASAAKLNGKLDVPTGTVNDATKSYASATNAKCQVVGLSAHQQECLKFLRSNVDIGHPRFTNAVLMKFLKARKFDLEQTADMLRAHLDFRKKWSLDQPTCGCRFGKGPPALVFSKLPSMKKWWPHGFHGVDRQGRCIYIERLGLTNMDNLFKEVSREEMMNYFAYESEYALTHRYTAACMAANRYIDKGLSILDLDGVSYSQLVDSRVLDVLRFIIKARADNYPETLGKMLIINAPYMFKWLWSIILPWLDPVTVSKFEIFARDPPAIEKRLKELVAPEQLPRFLGGTCSCKDNHTSTGCLSSEMGPWSDRRINEVLENTPHWEVEDFFFNAQCSENNGIAPPWETTEPQTSNGSEATLEPPRPVSGTNGIAPHWETTEPQTSNGSEATLEPPRRAEASAKAKQSYKAFRNSRASLISNNVVAEGEKKQDRPYKISL